MFERKWTKDADQNQNQAQIQSKNGNWSRKEIWNGEKNGNERRQKQRRPEDWNQGLGMEWAVVEFEKVGMVDGQGQDGKDGGVLVGGQKNPMEPLKFVEKERKQKSVRELLEKLRAGDG